MKKAKRILFVPIFALVLFCIGMLSTSPALASVESAEDALLGLTIVGDDTGSEYLDYNAATDDLPQSLYTEGDQSVTVTPTVESGYTYTISQGSNEVSNDQEAEIDLQTSTTTLYVNVTNSLNSDDTASFRIYLYMQNAVLDDLYIEGDTDDETVYLKSSEFDPDDYSYTLQLDSDEEYLYLYPQLADDDDSITVYYGTSTAAVSTSKYDSKGYIGVDLSYYSSLKTISIEVESNGYMTSTYKIYLEQSSDGTLEDLHINTGSSYSTSSSKQLDLYPQFDEDIYEYTVLLPYDSDISNVTLRAYVTDEDDYLTIDDEEMEIDPDELYVDHTVKISAGSNETVTFTAGSEDYTVTIYRASSGADSDYYLEDLRIQTSRGSTTSAKNSALELSPSFDEDETEYTLEVDEEYDTVYIYPEASDSNAFLFINDQLLTDSYYAMELEEGLNELEITIFAENCKRSQTYTVDIYSGEESSTSSSDANLQSLSLYSGAGQVSLSPSFRSSTYNYTGNVSYDVSTVYLSLATADSEDTVKVSFNNGSYTTVSGTSSVYTLSTGLNQFDIQVSSDSETNTYSLFIYRQAANPSIVVSSQLISIDGASASQIAAYNINGNNFLKLRDVAQLLSGTDKSFSVTYNESARLISLVRGGTYTPIGGELVIPSNYSQAVVSTQSIYLDNGYVTPMAYNIDGNNYFLLRDLALLFDFGVDYSAGTIYIDTSESYSYTD